MITVKNLQSRYSEPTDRICEFRKRGAINREEREKMHPLLNIE